MLSVEENHDGGTQNMGMVNQMVDSHEALKCFECMQREGLSPNVISFHLHFKGSHILQRGFLEKIPILEVFSFRCMQNVVT